MCHSIAWQISEISREKERICIENIQDTMGAILPSSVDSFDKKFMKMKHAGRSNLPKILGIKFFLAFYS